MKKTRPEIQEELNRLNELYQEYDLKLRKAGAGEADRSKALEMLNKKRQEILSSGDDLMALNAGKSIGVRNGTLSNMELSQKGMPDMSTVKNLGKPKNMFSKLKGALKGAKPSLGGLAGIGLTLGAGMLPDDSQAAEPIGPQRMQDMQTGMGNQENQQMDMTPGRMLNRGVKAAARAVDEGDPLSMLMGGQEAGENDADLHRRAALEKELRPVIEESELRGALGETGDETDENVRRWTKLKGLIGK